MATIKSKEEIKRVFGNRFEGSRPMANGYSQGEYVIIDLSKENLKKFGFAPKRGWEGQIEFCLVNLGLRTCVGMTGSMELMELPLELLPKKN